MQDLLSEVENAAAILPGAGESAVARFVDLNKRLISSRAKKIVSACPHLRPHFDDLLATAVGVVIECAASFVSGKKVRGVSKFLAKAIDRAIWRAADKIDIVGASSKYRERYRRHMAAATKSLLRSERNSVLYFSIGSGSYQSLEDIFSENEWLVGVTVAGFVAAFPAQENYSRALTSLGRIAYGEAVHSLSRPHCRKRHVEGFITRSVIAAVVRGFVSRNETDSACGPFRMERAENDPDTICRRERRPSETMEVILNSCLTECESSIAQLRAIGLNDREVGEKLNLSRSTVQESRAAIESRYRAACIATGA